MSDEVKFLPYGEAMKIVGAVMEEEHLHEPERRILTVYDKHDRELCWFDAEETLAEVSQGKKIDDETKKAAVDWIMHHIPDWVGDQD